MTEDIRITNNIRKLRFFANEMTQLELAERTGSSRSTIIAVEAGKYTPSLELAFRIANVFGVPVGEVFECRPSDADKGDTVPAITERPANNIFAERAEKQRGA